MDSTIDTLDEIPVPEALEIKLLRHKVGWSARRLGEELGISRSYIKRLESENDPLAMSKRLLVRWRALEKRIYVASHFRSSQRMVVFSKFRLPPQLVVLVRPRKCRGHRRYCLFRHPRQKYCGAECERLWRERHPRRRSTPQGPARRRGRR